MAASIGWSLRQIEATGAQGADLFWQFVDNPFVNKLIQVLVAIIVVGVLVSFSKIIAVFIKNRISKNFILQEGEEVRKIGTLVGDVVFYAMTMFSLYLGFKIVGFDIGLLLWWLAIGIGFAFRETLTNMISWIVIFSTKEYQLGNIIEVKVPGQIIMGRVEEVTMRNIILRGLDLRRIVIPNGRFLKSLVRTYSSEEMLKIEMDVIVENPLSIQDILDLTSKTVNAFDFVIHKEYTQILVDAFTEKAIRLKVFFTFNPNAWLSIASLKSKVNSALFEVYRKMKTSAKS